MILIGKRKVDFEKDGKRVQGVKLWFSYSDEKTEGVAVESFFIGSSNTINPDSLEIGYDYEPTYNKYGKPTDFIMV